ncbi:NAD(P)-binding protein [Cylindrobasidium torrendii FP15055 ss-10]|uniref:NAD(P)-binding protein n=1 Tax=Cylindrobasidium torrendii FP15055 ss-10 TaxID=1314674 RepID=A0A0D7B3S5_9AGAR|nr:NAD(P)-binding protein [Cylindrobasidium torrendii FP15055 ss-10]
MSSAFSTPPLQKQTALVTGGGTGIGLMIAEGLANAGAKVYITGRRLNVLEKAIVTSKVTDGTGSLVPFVLSMDVGNEEDIARAVETILQADGKLDVLVNNAGFAGSKSDPDGFSARKAAAYPADSMEPENVQDWKDIFHINSIMPFFVVRAFVPLLKAGAEARGPQASASVINISSTTSTMAVGAGVYGSLAYTATKAALEQMSLVLAFHFAQNNTPIRVNTIAPGMFPSEISDRNFGKDGLDELAKNAARGHVSAAPAKRGGRAEEMGTTAVYLASNAFVNGVVLKVDGGMAIVNP